MNEQVKEAEVVVAAPVDNMLALIKDSEKPIYQALSGMQSLNWKELSPPQMALLLTAKPFAISGGGTTYLTFKQALLFALRCHELGLSPFSDNVWYDPSRGAVNLTMSGKRELVRLRGIDIGPPVFEELLREWDAVPKITTAGEEARKMGFKKDQGIRCKIRVGDPKHAEFVNYTAWINDWFVSRSPVWKERPTHMLSIRANEKALTLILGTGASALPDEKELD